MNHSLLFALLCCTIGTTLCADPGHHPPYEPTGTPLAPSAVTPANYGMRVFPVSLRQRFDRDRLTGIETVSNAIRLDGWRGETVQAQVLVDAPAGIQSLTATSTSGLADIRLIRYTTGKGVLVPDIVDRLPEYPLPGVVRPLLITYRIPKTSGPTLTDTLQITVNGTLFTLPVTIDVATLTLPPPAAWAFHLDIWQHPDPVARWHDVPMWSPEHLMMLRPQMEALADMGQKTITCTLIDEAWQEQTHDRFRSMITVTKQTDGTWTYDYSAFDTWVSFARDTIGMKQATINCYTMIPWTLTFPYFDAATRRTVKPKLVPGTPEYEAFWGPFLTAFVEHLKTKGWLEITRIAMDERPDNLLKPTLALVQKYAPMLKIVAACDHPSNINRNFQDVSYAYDHCEKLIAELPERKAQGRTTTFYTCLHPIRPNMLMFSDLAESEWLIPMAAHYGLDGMLRWAFHSWEANPFQSVDHVRLPTGDTALMYPGDRLSLRLVAMRNGIETYEKIRILTAEAKRQQRPEVLAPLTEALNRFTVARGKQKGIHEADLIALDEALRTVTSALTTSTP